MKTNTFRKYDFTADLYSFTVTQDSTGGSIFSYSFERTITCKVNASGLGSSFFIFLKPEDSDVFTNVRLHNIRDAAGNELIENGVFVVGSIEPVLNVWGFREGSKARVSFFGVDG